MFPQKTLAYPDDVDVSAEAKDLLSHLLCDMGLRYDFTSIKQHPFFCGIDWQSLHSRLISRALLVICLANMQRFQLFHSQVDVITHKMNIVA